MPSGNTVRSMRAGQRALWVLTTLFALTLIPSQVDNPLFVDWIGRLQRQSTTPADFEPGEDHFPQMMPNWREHANLVLTSLTGRKTRPSAAKQVATVLSTDLVNSTAQASAMGDDAWHAALVSHNRVAAHVVEGQEGRIVNSTGDGRLATFHHPPLAVDAARSLVAELAALGFTIRAGLHSGQVEVHEDGDISGLAVNLAARIEHAANPGSVFVSSTVRELLLGGEHHFTDCGAFDLKGIERSWRLYSLND